MKRQISVRTLISDLEPEALREVIIALSNYSKKNEQFIKLFVQRSDEAYSKTVVDEAKNKIRLHFYGKSEFDLKLDLKSARKEVSDYSKMLKKYPRYIADLKLYYVEVGNEVTKEFGDIDERFYDSVESMFIAFCKYIREHPQLYAVFRDRLKKLYIESQNIGWGYSDFMSDTIRELQRLFEIDGDM
ncbi:hypothetical protein CYPRO_1325 [Cyclonatronum proteinivorum]|uniref:Uncharacterized protein n=1 Tax=Cyclonatronum proteinivorum TaxID=1457365 RepID=A0A345UJD0_9BACT|nr:hypothetical protein [Cyclonatronum proteinivorum]AXJ00582.1 hypothetical protein CYPRO_1325 [Cyclonatronum proteinivorum]